MEEGVLYSERLFYQTFYWIDMGRGDLLLLLTVSIGRYGRGCPLFRETFLPDVLLD